MINQKDVFQAFGFTPAETDAIMSSEEWKAYAGAREKADADLAALRDRVVERALALGAEVHPVIDGT